MYRMGQGISRNPTGSDNGRKGNHTVVATVFFFKAESKQTPGRDGCTAVPRTEGNISSDAFQNLPVCM